MEKGCPVIVKRAGVNGKAVGVDERESYRALTLRGNAAGLVVLGDNNTHPSRS
jgi:hypothetical protein